MKKTFLSYLFIISAFASTSMAEFQINTYTSLNQANADIAMDVQGNSLIVWSSYRQDGSSNGIFGQRFDSNCIPIGGEFQVNTTTSGNQSEPSVTMDTKGNFIVTWQSPGIDDEDIFARLYNPNAEPLSGELLVNTRTEDRQLYPRVAMNDQGNFVIAWENRDTPAKNKWISTQVFDGLGQLVGFELTVGDKQYDGRYPDVAMDSMGNFAIVWMRDKSPNSIMAKLYNADGSVRKESFEVSTIGFSSNTTPSIAMIAAGHFVVTWDGDPDRASLDDIHARLYKPNGTPLSPQFTVNTTTNGSQQYPQVAMNNQREFVIVWDSRIDPNVNERDIFGRRYNNLAQPIGDEFRINTYIIDDQKYPTVAIKDNGEFITAWQSFGQDSSHYGIFAEIGLIFNPTDFTKDGFVNFYDYCILAEEWLKEQNPLRADLINDNKIDELDLNALCEQWLMP